MKLRIPPPRSHSDSGSGTSRRRPGLALRLRTRVHRESLDRALAAGCPPAADAERDLRAIQLAGPATRRALARSLRRAVADAERPYAAPFGAVIPPVRGGPFGWRAALLGIAERLEQPVPVNPCGMARLMFLLTDGAGPLYNDRAERSLGGAIWEVVDGLEPCPPHDWDDPALTR